MKWLNIKEIKPPEYTWILLGKLLDPEDGFTGMVWQIGRYMPKTGFEFFDGRHCVGPFNGDSFWDFEPEETTHWMLCPDAPEKE
jgi:hypothetical protein